MKCKVISIILLTAFLLTGCTNLLVEPQKKTVRTKQNTSAFIKIKDTRGTARTILPSVGMEDLSCYSLSGIYAGKTVELGKWTSYDQMCSSKIVIDTGMWSFTLTAQVEENSETIFKGSCSNVLISNGDNELSFVLIPFSYSMNEKGGCNVSLTIPKNSTDSVVVSLYEYQESGINTSVNPVYQQKLEPEEKEDKLVYVFESDNIDSGMYYVEFQLLKEDFAFDYARDIISIADGYISYGSLELESVDEIYTIELNFNGGSMLEGASVPLSYTRKSTVALPDNFSMYMKGHDFAGWYSYRNLTGEKSEMIAPGTSGNLRLFAKWDVCTYSINFDANGGEIDEEACADSVTNSNSTEKMVSQDFEYAASQYLNKNVYKKKGHTFKGWSESPDGEGTLYSDESMFVMPENGTTLYAQWEKNRYTITYRYGKNKTVSYFYGDSVSLGAQGLSESGKFLVGWKTELSGGYYYPLDDLYVIDDKNITLYGAWEYKLVPGDIVCKDGSVNTYEEAYAIIVKGTELDSYGAPLKPALGVNMQPVNNSVCWGGYITTQSKTFNNNYVSKITSYVNHPAAGSSGIAQTGEVFRYRSQYMSENNIDSLSANESFTDFDALLAAAAYDDGLWYIPSKDEMQMICDAISAQPFKFGYMVDQNHCSAFLTCTQNSQTSMYCGSISFDTEDDIESAEVGTCSKNADMGLLLLRAFGNKVPVEVQSNVFENTEIQAVQGAGLVLNQGIQRAGYDFEGWFDNSGNRIYYIEAIKPFTVLTQKYKLHLRKGDIILKNGTIVRDTDSFAEKDVAGVVFKETGPDGQAAFIYYPEARSYKWSAYSGIDFNTEADSGGKNLGIICGTDLSSKERTGGARDLKTNYPAFDYVLNFSSGFEKYKSNWYIGTFEEYKTITGELYGASGLNDYYLTSEVRDKNNVYTAHLYYEDDEECSGYETVINNKDYASKTRSQSVIPVRPVGEEIPINYQMNGASLIKGAPLNHIYGSYTSLLPAEKYGFRFDGWFTDPEYSPESQVYYIDKDVRVSPVVYAKMTDLTPPGPVSDFRILDAGEGCYVLSWKNPVDDDLMKIELTYYEGENIAHKQPLDISSLPTKWNSLKIDYPLTDKTKIGAVLMDFNENIDLSSETFAEKEKGFVPVVSKGNTAEILVTDIKDSCPYLMNYKPSMIGVFTENRKVHLEGFVMGKTEVSQQLFKDIMGYNPSSYIPSDETELKNWPVNCISWYEAIAFCNKYSLLSGLDPCYEVSGISDWSLIGRSDIPVNKDSAWETASVKLSNNGYRLPTEAEWEYTARGGFNSKTYNFAYGFLAQAEHFIDLASCESDVLLDLLGWYNQNSDQQLKQIADSSKMFNYYSIFDMHGNVAEWCSDVYNNNATVDDAKFMKDGTVLNPVVQTGAERYEGRVQRGGSYASPLSSCTVSSRIYAKAYKEQYNDVNGMRLCRSVR